MNDAQLHPDPERLTAFALGHLGETESARIEDHLAVCAECSERLDAVPDDTFVTLLRGAADTVTHPAFDTADGTSRVKGTAPGATPSEPPPTLELPVELADHPRYLILGPLGAGGMGAVFKAKHRLMDRVVALKIINRRLTDRPAAVERFRREVKLAARISHPNIVTAYDAEHVGDTHFLVMEYIEGTSLAQLVESEGPLPVCRACNYARQTAMGLQHAFERGMVHRDLKPHNLMLARDGCVKILDFGLARFASESGSAVLTDSGTVMGTPDYISPEQAQDARAADIRADIYSLGCTLYFLLTGRPPFPGGTAIRKMLAHMHDPPPPLTEVRNDLPPELVSVIDRMMAKDPAQRYQTPTEVVQALTPFLQLSDAPSPLMGEGWGVGQPSRLSTTGETPVPPLPTGETPVLPLLSSYRKTLTFVGLLLVVGFAGFVIYRLTTDHSRDSAPSPQKVKEDAGEPSPATAAAPPPVVQETETGTLTWASRPISGQALAKDSYATRFSISGDGRFVVFHSEAGNLDKEDANEKADVFLYDQQLGTTQRVSTSRAGKPGNGASENPALSADGRFVAFQSVADNLVPDDTNDAGDIFVKDLQKGETLRVSTGSAGEQAHGHSYFPSISGDGRYVAFMSGAGNLNVGDALGRNSGSVYDVFVKDLKTGKLVRASTDSDGRPADNNSGWPSLSADGRYVAFESEAGNLVPDDTNGVQDVFVKDLNTGKTIRVSIGNAGHQADGASRNPALSADGRYVAFESEAGNLVIGDTNRVGDVFVRNLETGKTIRVSTTSAGHETQARSHNASINADGRYVAFVNSTPEPANKELVAAAQVYVKDLETQDLVRISTDRTGRPGDALSGTPSLSAAGRHAVFDTTADNLTPPAGQGKKNVFLWSRK